MQKMKITTSGPITLWKINGGKWKIIAYFIFLDYKITMDGECSHKIKRS